jgi:hypothetical protein
VGRAVRRRRGKLTGKGEVVIDKAFVNFRVGDGEDVAVLIDQKLCAVFGADRVFRSSRSMGAGTVFQPQLVAEATSCAVMVAVIGPRWLAENGGVRRIDEPGDWVCTEIALAMANKKPVIPVFVGDRPKLESKDNLPTSIAELVNLQYRRLHHRSAELDLVRIVDDVRPHVTKHGVQLPGPTEPVLLVSLGSTQRSSDLRFGSAQLNGTYFADSIVFRPSLFTAQPRSAISFNLGRRFRRLEVTVGVLDDAAEADQFGVFKVVTDRKANMQVTAKLGQPQLLSVDVSDVLNLRLEAHRPGTTAHPMMAGVNAAGGVSNKLPELAWGDPVVYP